MRIRTNSLRALFLRALAPALLLLGLVVPLAAQTPAPARGERLLNGLQIYFFQRPGAQKVWMRLRVNSGAAFDLAGKEGTARLLADALFDDPSTAQYVAEELGGSLDVRAGYDTMDITISGDAARFNDLVEVLRNALLQMRLTPDEVRRLKEARTKILGERPETAATKADRAVAARFFGSYPYGRAAEGTPESVARVERADLMLARDRFLNPNNSVLVVVGPVEAARAMRTFRQFLGPWRKSEETAPATFRRPDAPDARTLILDVPGSTEAEVRLAARGLPLSDDDHRALAGLAVVARLRWEAALKGVAPGKLFVGHEPHAISGLLRMGATVPAAQAAEAIEAARAALRSLAAAPVTAAEFETARRELSASPQSGRNPDYAFAENWLDSLTFGHPAGDNTRAFDTLKPDDLRRIAERLFRNAPVASVVAGDAAALRASLAGLPGGIEEANGSAKTRAAPSQPTPAAGRRPQ